ncbi:MAG: homoserine dehydrogenase, partial [Rhodospirillaceae bacterium]|nr:homoserine dehydrogenase [Rhodospirillaceae bacterium]
ANSLDSVVGILNGTCNYILTQMRESGRDFAEVLAEAQALGYAEADPSFDVDGIDAAHKLAILAALAFNGRVDFAGVMVEGIREISALDINFAEILGYRIKLLGIARRGADGRVALRVHPAMIAPSKPIASVEGVLNAVVAHGSPVGSVMSVGPGAGAGPTASAVVADLVDVVRGHKAPGFGAPADGMAPLAVAPPDARVGAYYLRLMVVDRPGVIADIAAAMRDHTISVESLVQRGRAPGEAVPVVIVTHDTLERQMLGAVARIAELDAVLEPPRLIRIEQMDD